MPREKRAYRILVFFARKGARGIRKPAAWLYRLRRSIEYARLPQRACFHMRDRPVEHRLRLLAEHPLPAARRVHQHGVKIPGKLAAQFRGLHAGHKRVPDAQAFHRSRKHRGAARYYFVCNQKTLPFQIGRKLPRLAAGRCAQIQHPHAGRGRKHGCGAHGGRLLHVKQACPVQRMRADFLHFLREQKPLRHKPGGGERKLRFF